MATYQMGPSVGMLGKEARARHLFNWAYLSAYWLRAIATRRFLVRGAAAPAYA